MMLFVSGLLLGVVAGVGIAALRGGRRSGPSAFGGPQRWALLVIAATVLVALAVVLSRRDRDDRTTAWVPSSTTSTTAAPSTSTPSTSSTTEPRAIVTVPALVGETRASALSMLRALGLHPSIQTIPVSSVPPDFVLSQHPLPASALTAGSTVSLVISASP